jgi:hypothetical protein
VYSKIIIRYEIVTMDFEVQAMYYATANSSVGRILTDKLMNFKLCLCIAPFIERWISDLRVQRICIDAT